MKARLRLSRLAGLALLGVLFTLPRPVRAGETLVVKDSDGNYRPVLATEWVNLGKSIRMVLRSGVEAEPVARQIAAGLAPWTVEASDAVTLVFRGRGLNEGALLEKLAGLPVEAGKNSEAARLAELTDSLGPALGDLSSAGSIRASKKIKLPAAARVPGPGPTAVVGKVVGVSSCEPLPTFTIKVLTPPSAGRHRAAFKKGATIEARGYYRVDDKTRKLVPGDARTRVNLAARAIKPGDIIYGKPLLREKGGVWILETIRPAKP